MRKAMILFGQLKHKAAFLIACNQVKNRTELEEAALNFQHYLLDVTGQKRIKVEYITLNW